MGNYLYSLPQAIVYALHIADRGLTTEALAYLINQSGLFIRRDGKPVTSLQIHWVVKRYPEVFDIDGGLVRVIQ